MGHSSLKGVMIGAGFCAKSFAEAWKRIEIVEFAAVADSLPGRAGAFARNMVLRAATLGAASMLKAEKANFADLVTAPESHQDLTVLRAFAVFQPSHGTAPSTAVRRIGKCEWRKIDEGWRRGRWETRFFRITAQL